MKILRKKWLSWLESFTAIVEIMDWWILIIISQSYIRINCYNCWVSNDHISYSIGKNRIKKNTWTQRLSLLKTCDSNAVPALWCCSKAGLVHKYSFESFIGKTKMRKSIWSHSVKIFWKNVRTFLFPLCWGAPY